VPKENAAKQTNKQINKATQTKAASPKVHHKSKNVLATLPPMAKSFKVSTFCLLQTNEMNFWAI